MSSMMGKFIMVKVGGKKKTKKNENRRGKLQYLAEIVEYAICIIGLGVGMALILYLSFHKIHFKKHLSFELALLNFIGPCNEMEP